MNFLDAVRSGLPFRRRNLELTWRVWDSNYNNPIGLLSGYDYPVSHEDILAEDWEVKRVPREWWLNTYPSGGIAYPSRESADEGARPSRWECVHVREVFDDGGGEG